ncbi:heat shock protein HtpX [Paenibacillus sp. 1_12]|uniref:zinc metalloprotease HtpX n=1 Tax=Paenibacillus sp. 1_12 TaxID=1566278 RepID=UPI0008F41147|nr:zinc metalloprotease HtpX [Paenibacillus sp. 1_12]SFL00920.1 heat shock protein HtpX [Paenibacillus sp. 1_12]
MLYRQIEQNKRKTVFLILLFSLLVLLVGWAVGYLVDGDYIFGIVLAAIVLVFYVPITYLSATMQVLSMSGATEIQKADNPMLFNIIEELSLAAHIPMPRVYMVDDPAPNAFATGIKPEKGAVAFTTGLLAKLNREELEGVVAHELSHIRNYDIRLMTICIALVGVIAIIADIGSRMLFYRSGRGNNRDNQKGGNPVIMIIALVFIILAPLAAHFVQLAVSRNREYLADASAVEFTRNPAGLKHALIKISHDTEQVQRAKDATASMYFANPFSRDRKGKASLFATHPSMESRIERLEQM